MPEIFDKVFPDEEKRSAQEVQALLESYLEQKKTGVTRLSYPLEKRLYFLFKRGQLINAYLVAPERWEAFSYEDSLNWARSAGEASVKSVPLSSAGLQLVKLLMHSQNAAERERAPRAEISKKIARMEAAGAAALLHLEWKNAAGAVFFPTEGGAHLILASPEALIEEKNCKALCEWDEPEAACAVFAPDLESEAWQEYYLRSAFRGICEKSLARFETLTGQGLIDSLTRLMNVSAERYHLEVTIERRRVTDNELFSSPQQALYNYRRLFAEMFDHFSAIIGPRLYVATLRDAALSLPSAELEIVRKFELLPKGYMNA